MKKIWSLGVAAVLAVGLTVNLAGCSASPTYAQQIHACEALPRHSQAYCVEGVNDSWNG